MTNSKEREASIRAKATKSSILPIIIDMARDVPSDGVYSVSLCYRVHECAPRIRLTIDGESKLRGLVLSST